MTATPYGYEARDRWNRPLDGHDRDERYDPCSTDEGIRHGETYIDPTGLPSCRRCGLPVHYLRRHPTRNRA